LAQIRSLLEQIAQNPQRKISAFTIPTDVGGELPPFVPRAAKHQATVLPAAEHPPARNAGFTFKKIFSRVYTQFGKP
jgi:hypothetical protein